MRLIFVNTIFGRGNFGRGNIRLTKLELSKKTFLAYCILNYPVYLIAEKEEDDHWVRVWTTYETLENALKEERERSS